MQTLWWRQQWQKNDFFLEKRNILVEAATARETGSVTAEARAQVDEQEILQPTEVAKMQKKALDAVRAGEYGKAPLGKRFGHLALVASGASLATFGAANAALEMSGSSRSGRTSTIEKRLDALDQQRVGVIGEKMGSLQARVWGLGDKSLEVLNALQRRLEHVTLALTEAESQLKQMEEIEAEQKEIRKLSGLKAKIKHPGQLVGNMVSSIGDGMASAGDKYLAIESRKGGFGADRLQKAIESLKEIQQKTEAKIAEMSARVKEEMAAPEKAYAHLSKHLGIEQKIIERMVKNYIENDNKHILTAIEKSSLENWHKKEMKNMIETVLKGGGAQRAKYYEVAKTHDRRMETIKALDSAKQKASSIREQVRTGKVVEKSTVSLRWNGASELQRYNIPRGRYTVKSIEAERGIIELSNGGRNYTLNLNKLYLSLGGDAEASAKIPLSYLESLHPIGVVSSTANTGGKKAEKTKSEAETTKEPSQEKPKMKEEPWKEEVAETTGKWELQTKGTLESTKNIFKNANAEKMGMDVHSLEKQELEGKILDILPNADKSYALIYFESEGNILCDIISHDESTKLQRGDDWKKPRGVSFSYQAEQDTEPEDKAQAA